MKKYIKLFFAATLFFNVACEHINHVDTNIDQSNGTINKNLLSSKIQAAMWQPEGSVVTRVNSHTVSVKAPEGWKYIYKEIVGGEGGDAYAAMASGASVSITCDCTKGTGCTASESGDMVGCIMGSDCQSCDLSSNVGVTLDGILEVVKIERGGFVKPKGGVRFVEGKTKLPMFMPEIFDIAELKTEIDNFLNTIYKNGEPPIASIENGLVTAPAGYLFAGINVFGRGASILVPVDMVEELQLASYGSTAVTFSCSCTDGGCEGFRMGYMYLCRAFDCTGTCTLSNSVASNFDTYVGFQF
jgi:hypothetical protein